MPGAGEAFDAVVVGSGATGGVAAMVLAEAGLRVAVLEAGPALTAGQALGREPANMFGRLEGVLGGSQRQQAQHPGYWKANPRLYVDERAHPYTTPADAPFLWSRGRQVGGRSLTWGGITLRLSDHDFAAAERDGEGASWPIRLADLAPYYSRLERLLGVHGGRDGLPQLPDGDTEAPLPLTPAERHLRQAIGTTLDLPLIASRGFRLHRPSPGQPWPRSSSPGVTLARALATGRVRLFPHSVVSHLELDGPGERARAVVVVDGRSGSHWRLEAPLVVLCASTIESLRILLHSSEASRGGGLVDPSGRLGRGLMDHVSTCRFFTLPVRDAPPPETELSGAGSCFIPNTLNLPHSTAADAAPGFHRGYGLWCGIQRFDPPTLLQRRPGQALGFLIGHGEVLADAANRVELESGAVDGHGLPVPRITCRWGENERAMVAHMQARMGSVVAAAGGSIAPLEDLVRVPLLEPLLKGAVALGQGAAPPGYYIHELGGAAMAADEGGGVLTAWNQLWRARNVLVTDGSSWPSAAWQSPTLTSMALTWRACAAAVDRRAAF